MRGEAAKRGSAMRKRRGRVRDCRRCTLPGHGWMTSKYTGDMAKIVVDPRLLPERTAPIPATKPPVFSLPYKDLGHPEEVEEFRTFLRELRRQEAARSESQE
jgi:hypothetical protein